MAAPWAGLVVALAALVFTLALLEDQLHLLLRFRLAALRPPAAGLLPPAPPPPAERPETLLEHQLAQAEGPAAAAALHSALARLLETAGRAEEALPHFEAARDEAAAATETAPPPLKLGEAIVWAGKEAEELAYARMALAQAYLARGRPADAEGALEPQLGALLGLDPVHVARLDGQIKFELGKVDLALLVYRFARERLERMGKSDPAAVEELARVHGGVAAARLRGGGTAEALASAREALALLGGSEDERPELAMELHRVLGDALHASGDVPGDSALVHYRAAWRLASRVRPARPRQLAELEDLMGALERSAKSTIA
mmetsp:Transcript_29765/g.85218  ORF Transcript_29765/g.85218 Transcript_29765/m.85218 type:complete len:318 (-) Transcript_29765:80-1033(-)